MNELAAIDMRVLKEDYRNYDLLARYWNGQYRGRVWKNKQRISDFIADLDEGVSLESILKHLKQTVDKLIEEKLRVSPRNKISEKDIQHALIEIAGKITGEERRLLVFHSCQVGQCATINQLNRQDCGNVQEVYTHIAKRIWDELGYPETYNLEIILGSHDCESMTLRKAVINCIHLLKWS